MGFRDRAIRIPEPSPRLQKPACFVGFPVNGDPYSDVNVGTGRDLAEAAECWGSFSRTSIRNSV